MSYFFSLMLIKRLICVSIILLRERITYMKGRALLPWFQFSQSILTSPVYVCTPKIARCSLQPNQVWLSWRRTWYSLVCYWVTYDIREFNVFCGFPQNVCHIEMILSKKCFELWFISHNILFHVEISLFWLSAVSYFVYVCVCV